MNMYTDKKNAAYSRGLVSMFPEQTRTIPRTIVWGLIFLLDLVGAAYIAFQWGLWDWFPDSMGNYLQVGIIAGASVFLFWLEGKIFYTIANLFR